MNNQDVLSEVKGELEAINKALYDKEIISEVFRAYPEFKELVFSKVEFNKFTHQFTRKFHRKDSNADLDIYALWFFYDFFQVDENMIKELKEQRANLLELERQLTAGDDI